MRRMIPMPSPVGTNFAGRYLPASFPYVNNPEMAMDSAMFNTRAEARIGADVGSYSFIVMDFHHLLLASLPAHSLALRPAGHFVRRRQRFKSVGRVWLSGVGETTRGASALCLIRPLASWCAVSWFHPASFGGR
jgi:hypothetical protein